MDVGEYQRAVLEHKDRVYSFAVHLLRDSEEGRDVAQEAMVRLFTHRDAVVPEAARAWLLRTAHRLCLDRLRQRVARPQAEPEMLDEIAAEHGRPDREAVGRQLGVKIEAALASLSPRDRSLLLLREVHGMPYEEMADTLSVPLGTLKAALHRARERCRQALLGAGVQP
jgi:RNA polymerase sigma-70 factor (ECF subfamily)